MGDLGSDRVDGEPGDGDCACHSVRWRVERRHMVKGDRCSAKEVVWSVGAGVGDGDWVCDVDGCGLRIALRLRVERDCGCGKGDAGDCVGDLESDRVDGEPGIDGNCEFGVGLVCEMIVGDVVVLLGWSTNESAIDVAEGCGEARPQENRPDCSGRQGTGWR